MSTDQLWYEAHGMRIWSDLNLPLPSSNGGVAVPDFRLTVGDPRPVPDGDPSDETIARLADDVGGNHYVFARVGERVVMRYRGLCDWTFTEGSDHVEANLVPGGDPGLLRVLGGGAVLAMKLLLDGRLVLHASAVYTPAATVAVVGHSGMGKSTVAALMCASASGALLTDDVLRVDLSNGEAVAHPGAVELRLRHKASATAETHGFGGRPTADGRIAIAPPHRVLAQQLDACLVPVPCRDVDEVTAQMLTPGEALACLSGFPRIVGMCAADVLTRQLHLMADLVESVPVLLVRIPWGPPFADDLGRRLVDRVTDVLATLGNGRGLSSRVSEPVR